MSKDNTSEKRGQNQGKTKRLWQIFFDDENSDEPGMSSDQRRTISSAKRSVKKGVNKALPAVGGGVLYQGLLEDETDSDEELGRGSVSNTSATPVGEPADLELGQRETVLFEKAPTNTQANGTANSYDKPFNDKDWESIDSKQDSWRPQAQIDIKDGGARYLIRSDSDLELAIPTTRRGTWCGCFTQSGSMQDKTEKYVCIGLIVVVMAAAYVAIVLGIVYGLK